MKWVCIEWYDAWSQDPWTNLEDAIKECVKPCKVVTIGYQIAETDECIVVCHSLNKTDNMVCGVMHIPKSCIKRIKR